MPDDLRSPIKHHLVLHRIDPEQGIRRFYSLMIERDLFGTVRLVRNWGRIGTNGQELVEIYDDEIAAGEALEAVARVNPRLSAACQQHAASSNFATWELTSGISMRKRLPWRCGRTHRHEYRAPCGRD